MAYSNVVFVISQKKKKHLYEKPHATNSIKYDDWIVVDSCIITWLMNSMQVKVCSGIIFMKIAQLIWEHVKNVYSNERNISPIAELYEQLFSLKQGVRHLNDYYLDPKMMYDELETHQPPIFELNVLKQYREELIVPKFLVGLEPTLAIQLRGQLLSGDIIPTLDVAFSRVRRDVVTYEATPPWVFYSCHF